MLMLEVVKPAVEKEKEGWGNLAASGAIRWQMRWYKLITDMSATEAACQKQEGQQEKG